MWHGLDPLEYHITTNSSNWETRTASQESDVGKSLKLVENYPSVL